MPTSPANDEEGESPELSGAGVEGAPGPSDASGGADEVAELRSELARTQDRYRRALADLDNYRKRMEREGDRRATQARDGQLREWLEALDSVERALTMEPGDPGLTAVLEQMDAILVRNGIVRLAEVGEPFDPVRHEAIAVQPSTDVPDKAILAVARSGFGTGDGDVLRTAQVVVATRPSSPATSPSTGSGTGTGSGAGTSSGTGG
jgi:Molecular chaperone GrpE (heat shock protein)